MSDDTIVAVEAPREDQLRIAAAARDDFNRLRDELNALEERVDRAL